MANRKDYRRDRSEKSRSLVSAVRLRVTRVAQRTSRIAQRRKKLCNAPVKSRGARSPSRRDAAPALLFMRASHNSPRRARGYYRKLLGDSLKRSAKPWLGSSAKWVVETVNVPAPRPPDSGQLNADGERGFSPFFRDKHRHVHRHPPSRGMKRSSPKKF